MQSKRTIAYFLRTSMDVMERVCPVKKKMVQKGKAKGINFNFNGVNTGFLAGKKRKMPVEETKQNLENLK